MILHLPPSLVLNVSRKGCNALLKIEDSDGIIPVIISRGSSGRGMGCYNNKISISHHPSH
jgi:hypothetical protein